MFSFSKDDVKSEHLDTAYKYLKEYCDKKGVDVVEFVKNKENIPEAAKEINKGLPWIASKFFTVTKIQSLLTENIDFIIAAAESRYESEAKGKPKMKT